MRILVGVLASLVVLIATICFSVLVKVCGILWATAILILSIMLTLALGFVTLRPFYIFQNKGGK